MELVCQRPQFISDYEASVTALLSVRPELLAN